MLANSEGSRPAGDAAIILDMHQPPRLIAKDSAADMQIEAAATAAACTHDADASSQPSEAHASNGLPAHAGGAGKPPACAGKGQVSAPQLSSIYEVFSRRQRGLILGVVSISQFINPFSSSIILPSLKLLQSVFNTSSVVGAAIIAFYYLPVGIASLLWGPACDVWGRKATYLASTALYAAATVGCIFPVNISMLLAFRALQGVALGAHRGAGVGAIADIYPPQQRGLAIGTVMVSTLVGPVIGPVLGGFLAEAYGWRAPFIALLAFSGLILLCCSLAMRETHQYKTLQRLIKQNPSAKHTIAEAPQILAHKPRFTWRSPWTPIAVIFDKQIVPHLLVGLVGFAALVSSQTELPMVLAGTYNLSPGLIGVSMLPTGIAGMVFSPIGGRLFDRAAAASPGHPMLRLRYNNLLSLFGMPAGLLLWGWAAHMRAHLAVVFVGLSLVGGSMCVYLPAVMGYLTCVKQHQASTAAAGQNALTFVVAGALILAGSAIATSIGIGWYCTILAVLHAACGTAAQLQIHWLRLATKRAQQAALQLTAASAAASSTDGITSAACRNIGDV